MEISKENIVLMYCRVVAIKFQYKQFCSDLFLLYRLHFLPSNSTKPTLSFLKNEESLLRTILYQIPEQKACRVSASFSSFYFY